LKKKTNLPIEAGSGIFFVLAHTVFS